MTKKIIYSLISLISGIISAQQGNTSAYAMYGLGDIKQEGTIENRSMGGVSIQSDSIHINLQNPAGYANLKLSTFTFGLGSGRVNSKDNISSGKSIRTTLDYFSVGLPTKRFGIGFGLKPYSHSGYNVFIPSDGISTDQKSLKGQGGLNRVYLAAGLKLHKTLQIGIEGNYNFGNIETTHISNTVNAFYDTKEYEKKTLSGFGLNVGLQFSSKINSKLSIFSGITYSPEIKINAASTKTISTTFDTTTNQTIELNPTQSYLPIPAKTSFGLGIGENKKWFTGIEITKKSYSNSFKTNGISNATYEDATKFAFGSYYIPNYNSYSNYLKKITYRLGFRYENTGLVVKNISINEYGTTFGLGLPLTGIFSNINIGAEYGKRGTTTKGLIEEKFVNIMIGLSLNDKWFNKRKID